MNISNYILNTAGKTVSAVLKIKIAILLVGFIPTLYVCYSFAQSFLVTGELSWYAVIGAVTVLMGASFLLTMHSGLKFAELLKNPELAMQRINTIKDMTSQVASFEATMPSEISSLKSFKEVYPVIKEAWSKKDDLQDILEEKDGVLETIEQAKNAIIGVAGITFLLYPVAVLASLFSLAAI